MLIILFLIIELLPFLPQSWKWKITLAWLWEEDGGRVYSGDKTEIQRKGSQNSHDQKLQVFKGFFRTLVGQRNRIPRFTAGYLRLVGRPHCCRFGSPAKVLARGMETWYIDMYVSPFHHHFPIAPLLRSIGISGVLKAEMLQPFLVRDWTETTEKNAVTHINGFRCKKTKSLQSNYHDLFLWHNSNLNMGVSSNGGTPISHPKWWSFLVGKPMVVGETHHFRNPPYLNSLVWDDPIFGVEESSQYQLSILEALKAPLLLFKI